MQYFVSLHTRYVILRIITHPIYTTTAAFFDIRRTVHDTNALLIFTAVPAPLASFPRRVASCNGPSCAALLSLLFRAWRAQQVPPPYPYPMISYHTPPPPPPSTHYVGLHSIALEALGVLQAGFECSHGAQRGLLGLS